MSKPDEGRKTPWWKPIGPAVVIALATAGSAPWWVARLFPSHNSEASNSSSVTRNTSVPTSATSPAGNDISGPTSPPVPTPDSGSRPLVRNATLAGRPITLESGYGLDLDSSAQTWNRTAWTSAQLDLDVVYDGVDLGFRKYATAFSAQPTAADCAAATTFVTDVPLVSAPELMYFCVRTSEERASALTVHVADMNHLILDITTWQGSG